jgi:hypothetical protein
VRVIHAFAALAFGAVLYAANSEVLGFGDTTVIAKLPSEQRANLTVLNREGQPEAGLVYPSATDAPVPLPTVAAAPVKTPGAKTSPATAPLPVVKIAVAPPKVPKPPPSANKAVVAAVVPAANTGMMVAAGRTFVPTEAGAKPSGSPTPEPASSHDLAYAYAHRFDKDNNEDVVIPGVPVRSQVSSPFDTKSGAFHGVRARNGQSSVRAIVTIPCGVSHFQTAPGYNQVTARQDQIDQETGYIYVGGWGAGGRGAAVDAGLQKSSAQSEHDDYAFYWKYDRNHPVTSNTRFPCGGPDVILEMYPASSNLLVFSATGVTTAGVRQTLTIAQRTTPDDGWIPSGGSATDGVIIKRIVSIAQPAIWRDSIVGRLRWSSGTYFGIGGPSDPIPKIVWRDCELGRVTPPRIVPQYHKWTQSDTWVSSSPNVYSDWPPRGVLRPADAGNTSCDAVGLFLRSS